MRMHPAVWGKVPVCAAVKGLNNIPAGILRPDQA